MRKRFWAGLALATGIAACGARTAPEELGTRTGDNSSDAGNTSSAGTSPAGGFGSGASGAGASGAGGAGVAKEGPSCDKGLDCGGVSCCQSRFVRGGPFLMGRGNGTDAFAAGYSDELPEHSVSVKGFHLDLHEVTVGRFRRYLETYQKPAPGAGAHPGIANSGWNPSWDGELGSTAAAVMKPLKCSSGHQTWTDTPGSHEGKPLNCITWYAMFAFCAWDGGRLPTEAEWEFAAAGGSENRLYPWGAAPPDATLASFGCGASGCKAEPVPPVGSTPLGKGRWDQQDLAGSLWEWALDWHDDYATSCGDCVNIASGSRRVIRGGDFYDVSSYLRAAFRYTALPFEHADFVGGRCARDH